MSNNFGRTETTAGQEQKEVTLNASDAILDAALSELVVFTVTNDNILTLSTAQAQASLVYQFDDHGTPPTELVVITYPAVQRGLFIVKNNMTFPLTISIAAQGGTPPVVDAGETRTLQCDGVNVEEAPAAKQAFHGALVNINATQAIVTSTFTDIRWDVEKYDLAKGRNQFWLGSDATITAAADDEVTLAAHLMETGDGPFQFTTTVTLPAGLALATDYWAIKTASGTFRVATSLALALAGTQVDITDAGTGTHTIDRETRLVVPPGVTKVRLALGTEFAADGTGERMIQIKKNGGGLIGGANAVHVGNTFGNFNNGTTAIIEVVGGDYFDVEVWQNSGGNLNLNSAASRTWFSIEEVR